MAVSRDEILGSDYVRDALKTKVNDDMTELFTIAAEVEAARDSTTTGDSHADLDTRLESIEASIVAGVAGDGALVSSDDTTPGYLNGKLVAGEGIDFTEGNGGGDETLTISGEDASATNKGVASFDDGDFVVSSGAVSLAAGNLDSIAFFMGICF